MNQLVLPDGDLEVEDRREFELLGAARVPRVPRDMECRGLVGEALPTKGISRFQYDIYLTYRLHGAKAKVGISVSMP